MATTTTMKGRFDATEWGEIRTLPFQVFLLVGIADGTIDQAESKFFDTDFKAGAFAYKDMLLREIALDFYSSGDPISTLIESAVEAWKTPARRIAIKSTLTNKLSTDEYQRFMNSLVILGRDTAQASDGGAPVTDKATAMDPKELGALQQFVMAYDIDLTAMARLLG